MTPSPRRYLIVGITAVAALWMYIDRTCFSTVAKPVAVDLNIDKSWIPDLLGAFFLTYALFQIPIGGLADRFGPRVVLTGCIAAWSAVVAAMAFADGVYPLLALRLALGVAEAGAYPAASALVKNWAAPGERGRMSSYVALGGRIGGGVAPALTSSLAVATAGWAFLGPRHPDVEGNWRAVFLIFGLVGLAVALVFWVVVRDRPERAGSAEPSADPTPVLPWRGRLAVILASRNMWLFGAKQFLVNIGWAFLITLLPVYLSDVHHTRLEDIGLMQSTPLLIGLCGMLAGGVLSDALTRRLGRRWGRAIPFVVSLSCCAAAYLFCVRAANPWVVIAALSVMAFCVDMANPSTWAFSQDVGGRFVGTALGWGNMLGNIGAYFSPKVFAGVADRFGWDAVFGMAAGAFAAAAVCGALLNADQPLEPTGPPASR